MGPRTIFCYLPPNTSYRPVVTELSLAIATARVFPSLKRGLGFARSCSLVDVAVEPRRTGIKTIR